MVKTSQSSLQNGSDSQHLRLEYLTGGPQRPSLPPEISGPDEGGKFSPDGAPNFFPGNTFICHVDPASQAHKALTRLSSALMKGPTGDYFTFLPPSSFHMTVFPAICGNPLGYDGWPRDIAVGQDLATIHDIYQARLAERTAFKTCTVKPIDTMAGTSVILEGATAQDSASLWAARNMLQDVTGLFRPDFGNYRFHISLCYRTRWMDLATARDHLAYALPLFYKFQNEAPSLQLGQIELCKFQSMHSFEVLEYLDAVAT